MKRATALYLFVLGLVVVCGIGIMIVLSRTKTAKVYRAQGQNKSKKVLRLEPISKLKDRMRRIVWHENVQDVIKYSHEKPVIRRLEKLLAA